MNFVRPTGKQFTGVWKSIKSADDSEAVNIPYEIIQDIVIFRASNSQASINKPRVSGKISTSSKQQYKIGDQLTLQGVDEAMAIVDSITPVYNKNRAVRGRNKQIVDYYILSFGE